MLLYAPLPEKPRMAQISDLLYQVFHQDLDEEQTFAVGSRQPFVRKAATTKLEDDPQPVFASVPMSPDRLKLSLHGNDYFAQEESARRQGINKHRDMAAVEIDAELEAQSGHRHWFDGTYRVMNEASIVDATGEIKRPDRVLLAPDGSRVIVIDYKFGTPHAAHRRQVKEYVSLLQQMGYPAVEGWLWYVAAGDIVQV